MIERFKARPARQRRRLPQRVYHSVGPNIGSQRLAAFTAWCRLHHRRAFVGEFAAGDSPVGHAAVDDTLSGMEAAPDVCLGCARWAAGPWWGDYMFTLEPKPDGTDRPQMAWLAPHLHH